MKDLYQIWESYYRTMKTTLDPRNEYNRLFAVLHSIPFSSDNTDDLARVDDAWYVRSEEGGLWSTPPSTLEVLYAFAQRIALVTATTNGPLYYFRVILSSALLEPYTDKFIETFGIGQDEVQTQVLNLLDRNYAPDGTGGYFRIKGTPIVNGKPVTDMRELGMWWQAVAWMVENEPEE